VEARGRPTGKSVLCRKLFKVIWHKLETPSLAQDKYLAFENPLIKFPPTSATAINAQSVPLSPNQIEPD
jgi:hypothetical protein